MRPWEREPQETTTPPASSPPSSSPVQVKFSVSSLVVKPSDSVAGGGDFEPGEVHAAGFRIRDEFPSSPLRPRSYRFQQESGRGIRAGSVSPIHQRGADRRYARDIDNSKAQQHGREIWAGMGNGKFRDHSPTYGNERGGERYRDLSPTYGRGRSGDGLHDLSPPHGHGSGRGTERFQEFSSAYGRGRGRGSFRDISPPSGFERRGGRFRDFSPPYGRGRGRGRFRDLSPPYGRGVGRGRFRDLSPPYGRGVGRGRFRDLSPPYGRGGGRGRFREFSPTSGRGRYRDFPPLSDHKTGGPGRGGFHEPSPRYGRPKDGGKFQDLSPPYDQERGGRSLERSYEETELGLLPIRGESDNRNDPNLSPRVGDWICRNPLCGNLNFARRDYCNNCNKLRYAPGEVVPASSPQRSYSGPPPPHQSPPRRPGPPAGRGMRRGATNGYRSPRPHGWAREGPGDPPPSPRHRERFLSRRRGRPDYDEDVDYRERGKFEKPVTYELDYRDHRGDEPSVSERRGRPPSPPPDRWISRERSRSPMRGDYRRGSFMGRGRGGRWGTGRGRNERY